jgi:hypothetical protein
MALIDPQLAQAGDLVLVLNRGAVGSAGPAAWAPSSVAVANPGGATLMQVAARPSGGFAGYATATGAPLVAPALSGIYAYRTI